MKVVNILGYDYIDDETKELRTLAIVKYIEGWEEKDYITAWNAKNKYNKASFAEIVEVIEI